MPLTLLLGGARSGKSALAVRLGTQHTGPVVFIATCPRIVGDNDLERRIERHRSDRPDWPTDEEPHDLSGALAQVEPDAMAIVDCLSLWVSNLMLRGDDAGMIVGAATSFAHDAVRRTAPTVVVSNEVGMGVHPETTLGRSYRDVLGSVNQAVGSEASPVLLLVAGRAIELRDSLSYFPGDDQP